MGSVRPPQRRKHNTFVSPSSSLLSTRPFAPTTSPPSSSLLPKDQPASPVQVKGFSYSFERMAVHHPAPEVTAGNEAEPVASGEMANLFPRQLIPDAGLLAEQDQPMPTTHGNESPTPSSALQRMRVPASNPVTPPPPANRRTGTKRTGWSIERMAITHNPLPPAQSTAANDAPGIQEPLPQTEVLQQVAAESATPRENTTGLPDHLKTGIESLSGLSLDDVHVYYNSSRPAQVDALAYTQGTEIHVGPGQEQHLAHEAWHVVQQKEGRVQPTVQAKGVAINDDQGLEREADVMGERAARSLPSAGVSVAETMTALPETMQLARKKVTRQSTKDIDILYEDAAVAFEYLKKFTEQFAQETGGTAVIPLDEQGQPSLKKRDKTIGKAIREYRGDRSRVLDIARTTIKYNTMKQIDAIRTQIKSRLPEILPGAEIARTKDSFAEPTETGYRDLKYNIKMPNGHIIEIQVNLVAMEKAKKKQRKHYDDIFEIRLAAKKARRKLTPEEDALIADLLEKSNKIFDEALEDASGE